jgi:hypothetical protein
MKPPHRPIEGLKILMEFFQPHSSLSFISSKKSAGKDLHPCTRVEPEREQS